MATLFADASVRTLTRLYSPLTALANARVDVMTALVAFERVFEVLDVHPMITERPDARTVPPGEVSVEFDTVHFGYPCAERVSLASLEEVAASSPTPPACRAPVPGVSVPWDQRGGHQSATRREGEPDGTGKRTDPQKAATVGVTG